MLIAYDTRTARNLLGKLASQKHHITLRLLAFYIIFTRFFREREK